MASRVYDASAFYAGVPFASPELGLTTTLVFEEISHIKKSHGALEILLDTNRLQIQDPDPASVKFVSNEAKKTGDVQKLSKADISAVALTHQLGATLITDDFAISNLAKNLRLQVQPIMTKGIRDVGKWLHYCSGCRKEFSGLEFCPNCGNKLNRKLLKL
ncbi:MAG: nucleotide-binding protein [Thaumarchaeota archaeon]|nr:nucleotide-binding protein [Nitrososphaerota archaeon]